VLLRPWHLAVALALFTSAATASVPREEALAGASRDVASLRSLTAGLASPAAAESGFGLFGGDDLGRALDNESGRSASRFALGVAAEDLAVAALEPAHVARARELRLNLHRDLELLAMEPLRGPPTEAPKTRIGVFDFLGTKLIGVESGVSLELHWGSGRFGLKTSEGIGVWLSEDPMGDVDSPNLYGFVAGRPHEATDPLGLEKVAEYNDVFQRNTNSHAPDPNGSVTPLDMLALTLGTAGAAYQGAWDVFLKATGGNRADQEAIEIMSGLGFFRELRLAEGATFLAQRGLQGAGKALDKIPVNAREFNPSMFGVGNLQKEEKVAEQIAMKIGQKALPAAEDFPWAKYQKHVTGLDFEETWLMNQKNLGVDATAAGYTVEAKWAGKNAAAWKSSPYNPSSEFYNEPKILGQAKRLLEKNAQTKGGGVRYAISNDPAAKHFAELFEKNFPDEMKSGALKVWTVPGNGM
jgi:hypothetical protein